VAQAIEKTRQSAAATGRPDERVRKVSAITQIMQRPELGAIAGLIFVIVFFAITARPGMFTLNGLLVIFDYSATLGIAAIAAALLMIGGEFDLSIGSMVAFTGLIFGMSVTTMGLPLILAIPFTFVVAMALGALNGQLVIRTRLPSFIVTLAFLFILSGFTLVGLKIVTGGNTQLSGIRNAVGDSVLVSIFSGKAFPGLFIWMADNGWVTKFPDGTPSIKGVPVSILWFIGVTIVATWIMLRTRTGNWIFASGGHPDSARNSGVPVARVKTALFMVTASAAALTAIITVLNTGSADAKRGDLLEFKAIIAAVIGGCLLTGGYGSAIGAFIGALIFGLVSIGLGFTTFDADYFKVFLGAMLLIAVLLNNYIRRKVTGER
jgi:simple sugar transport system permease protein